ncbi:hypothetical protein B566_EDAN004781 [Ephemera danica]|nr:hypothetical protein B566_EDAN004781 [Ephemera danica]
MQRRNNKDLYATVELETWEERQKRWRSIRIVYFIMLMTCMGLTLSKEDLGTVVAAGALGQMIFSPIFGFWGNHAKSASVPMMLAMPVAIY